MPWFGSIIAKPACSISTRRTPTSSSYIRIIQPGTCITKPIVSVVDIPPKITTFFQRVAELIADAGVILITGPANAKTELLKHIEQHKPDLASRVAAVETVDHPSDRQLIDHARRYFWADHQTPLRMRR